jgi:WD40 repeat protein
LTGALPELCLQAVAPLPDLPHPALRRTFTGHTGSVEAVAIAPDGSWLATSGWDGAVRIWDPVTGSGVASTRVSGPLTLLEWVGMTLVAAGAFGPYIFKFNVKRTTQ